MALCFLNKPMADRHILLPYNF